MLEIRNLSKSYGEKKAVCNLNLIVEDGDIMGFIGKNGAGKTTTLKSCLGIVGIDKGEILLDGVSILKEPIVCKKKMAYVPDNPQLDEYMTGIQYLNFIADIYAVPSQNRKYIIEKLASTFQMEPHLNSLINNEIKIYLSKYNKDLIKNILKLWYKEKTEERANERIMCGRKLRSIFKSYSRCGREGMQ